MTRAVLVASILALLVGVSPAEEPPSWVALSNLAYALDVRDIVEIPGSDILVACGHTQTTNPSRLGIWRSTDRGQSWSDFSGGPYGKQQLARDSSSGELWAVDSATYGTLVRSTNDGQSWTGVSGPVGPISCNNTIAAIGDYLYLGVSMTAPYCVTLYRLNQTNLQWETVTTYPECNAITRLKYNNGKLLVFARDTSGLKTRVFSYTP
jgi:photosystem II stability/assembly factor-like uncharacterized protein